MTLEESPVEIEEKVFARTEIDFGAGLARTGGPRSQTIGEAMAKSAARSIASTAGRQITNAILRGVLGSLKR